VWLLTILYHSQTIVCGHYNYDPISINDSLYVTAALDETFCTIQVLSRSDCESDRGCQKLYILCCSGVTILPTSLGGSTFSVRLYSLKEEVSAVLPLVLCCSVSTGLILRTARLPYICLLCCLLSCCCLLFSVFILLCCAWRLLFVSASGACIPCYYSAGGCLLEMPGRRLIHWDACYLLCCSAILYSLRDTCFIQMTNSFSDTSVPLCTCCSLYISTLWLSVALTEGDTIHSFYP